MMSWYLTMCVLHRVNHKLFLDWISRALGQGVENGSPSINSRAMVRT